jgi:hypothetical protein
MLSDAAALAFDLAKEIKLQAVAAGTPVTAAKPVERLLLAMRRCLALKDLFRQRHQEDRHQAEDRRERRRADIGERRRKVAEGVSRVIAALKPESSDGPDRDPRERQERLTDDIYDRVFVDERLTADLADTALPIEALILSLCREFGAAATWLDIANGTPGEATAKVAAWQQGTYGLGRFRVIPAADIGLPEGQLYLINTDTGAVFNEDGMVVKTLMGQPVPPESSMADSPPPDPGPGNTGPPDATAPPAAPDPAPPPGPTPRELTLAERAEADRQRRREALEVARAENARIAERYRQRQIDSDKRS